MTAQIQDLVNETTDQIVEESPGGAGEEQVLLELLKLAVDPGFNEFRVARVIDKKTMFVDSVPSVVGMGSKNLGWLSSGFTIRGPKAVPHEISFNGTGCLVGANVHRYVRPIERMDYLRLAEGPELKALLYTSLWKALGSGSHRVALMIGQPVEIVKNTEEARKLLASLQSWLLGEHSFVVDGQEVNTTVERVKITSQPLGTYYHWAFDNEGKFKQPREAIKSLVAIGDVGFNTVDLFTVENGQIVGRYSNGDDVGMKRANETIQAALHQRFDVKPSLHETDALIRLHVSSGRKPAFSHSGGEDDVSDIVQQGLDQAFGEMSSFMNSHWGNGKQFRYLILTGGGVQALRRQFIAQYPRAIIMPNPVTSNAEGLAKYAIRPKVFAD